VKERTRSEPKSVRPPVRAPVAVREPEPPLRSPEDALLQLHRAAGNLAVQRLLAGAADAAPTGGSGDAGPRSARPRRRAGRLLLQRAPADAGAATPTPAAAPAAPTAAAGTAAAAPRIVEDGTTELAAGQMRKSDFLAQLRGAVGRTAEEGLAGTMWSAVGCPWIDHWFGYYSGRSGAEVERTVRRYAPETAGAPSAQAFIPLICARVRLGIDDWKTTGRAPGAPGPAGAALPGSRPSGVGGLLSSAVAAGGRLLGRLFFKRSAGEVPTGADPLSVMARLGSGHSLDTGVKARMEGALGHDFSPVRVHDDPASARLAGQLGARAFTVGRHVAFGPGEFQPGTPVGDALIAHELAHVVQQSGASAHGIALRGADGERDALEHEADRSAIGAVLALWSSSRRFMQEIPHTSFPRLKSGLRLQACREAPTATAKGLQQARKAFVSYNTGWTGDLSLEETGRIHAALQVVVGDNVNLWVAFYHYYSSHEINKMSGQALVRARERRAYAETDPNGDTRVDPNILLPSFSQKKLGTLLIHEFVHTHHTSSALGFGDYQEGEAYGIEYFLARRSNATGRLAELGQIMGAHAYGTDRSGYRVGWRNLFNRSYVMMRELYNRIDGRPVHPGAPAELRALSPGEARALVAELIAEGADSNETLRTIKRWVKKSISSLGAPL